MRFKTAHRRRGAIAPMVALFLIFLLGMVAFAVDLSWIVLAKSELQNAADAAALAAAQQLMNNYATYNLPGQSTANKSALLSGAVSQATSSAKTYASANAAGAKSLTLLDNDIAFGFTDASGAFTAYTNGGPYPNTVKVTLRRDSSANSPLALFFGPTLGVKSMDLTAQASATVYSGVVSSFKPGNTAMLPMTYDVNAWKNFVATGTDPDGNTSTDSNGNPQIQIYPSVSAPGNFGELSLNDSHNGASTTTNWINNGVNSSDIQALLDNKLIPLSSHPANTWDWQGNPGFKASNVMAVNNNTGNTYWMPLFQPYSGGTNYSAGTGQGANYFYDIVAFVPVTIMPTSQSNRNIIVQPATLIDPNAVFDPTTLKPAGTGSAAQNYTVAVPKLTN